MNIMRKMSLTNIVLEQNLEIKDKIVRKVFIYFDLYNALKYL